MSGSSNLMYMLLDMSISPLAEEYTFRAECRLPTRRYRPLTAKEPHAIFRVPTTLAHSSRGPGRRPLTAVTRVRIPYALPRYDINSTGAPSAVTPRTQGRQPRICASENPGGNAARDSPRCLGSVGY